MNIPPIALANVNYTLGAGGSLVLDGLSSTDPDNGPSPLTYEWNINGFTISGPSHAIAWSNLESNHSFAPRGSHMVDLTVYDDDASSSYPGGVSVTDPSGPCGPPGPIGPNLPPEFLGDPHVFSIAEDALLGNGVGGVLVSDPDVGDIISFTLAGGGPFSIDMMSGAITVTGPLDCETIDKYILTATVTDIGGLSETAAVTIEVADVVEVGNLMIAATQYHTN